MRILRAKIQNYRLHRDLELTFDPRLTLIGGPNECGKSTLVEALHRAFFLRARTTGQGLEAMLAESGGHPEVQVEFEVRGGRFVLIKRFAGPGGRASLVGPDGSSLEGDEAENRLAVLLGEQGPNKFSGIQSQWSHVWVWQGQSWADPSEQADDRHEDIVRCLQEAGGGAALQSDRDSRVAGLFARRQAEIFTSRGEFKKGTRAYEAEEAVRLAAAEMEKHQTEVEFREQAAQRLEWLVQDIERREGDLLEIQGERGRTDKALEEVRDLQERYREEHRRLQGIETEQAQLQAVDAEIRDLEEKVRRLEEEFEPKEKLLLALQEDRKACRKRLRSLEDRVASAERSAEKIRFWREFVGACRRDAEAGSRVRQIRAELEDIETREQELKAVRQTLQALPETVSRSALERLQKMQAQAERAELTLQSRAMGLKLNASDQEVRVDGRELAAGEQILLEQETVLRIGEGTEFLLVPGGERDLEQARTAAREAGDRLTRGLQAFGVESMSQAESLFNDRLGLERKLANIRDVLAALDPDGVRLRLEEAEAGRSRCRSEMERVRSRLPQGALPEGCTVWPESRLLRMEVCAARMEDVLRLRRGKAEDLKQEVEALEERLDKGRQDLLDDRRELDRCRGRLESLKQQAGDEKTRTKNILAAARKHDLFQAALEQVDERLAELEADELPARKERLERAADTGASSLHAARTELEVLKEKLRYDGYTDPVSEAVKAGTRHAEAQKELKRQRRTAEAVRLVHTLFLEEKKQLADRFSQPLAERITRYLACVFGPKVRAGMRMNEQGVKGVELMVGARALDFHQLSLGAREQVAAAVRLAMAELLARDHDGSLPVFFDDAFAYSDPQRIKKLQSMLDMAARNGLQIIVLSCNPSDYAGLGALTVDLNPMDKQAAS